jgi:hypothetical protein
LPFWRHCASGSLALFRFSGWEAIGLRALLPQKINDTEIF